MKKINVIVFITLLSIGTTYAQQSKQQNLVKEAQHYVKLFELNESQAQQFTQDFYAYNKQMHAVKQQYRQENSQEKDSVSDTELEQRILNNFAMSRAILDVREHYYKEWRKTLTPAQIKIIFNNEKARRAHMHK